MCAASEPPALGDPAQLGRLLTRLEDDPGSAAQLLARLPAPVEPGHRVGVTGSPGVGKSTLLKGLIGCYRRSGQRVGVVAVDPTSPLSGGAILGDRLRLGEAQLDDGVFIRSLASRGSLGGVTPGASAVAAVLEAAGYGRILIETVGVGQTGYDVVNLADTVVALFSPEAGDGVQLLKAGILEIGDIFAVNKSDRPGAELMLKEIMQSFEGAAGGAMLHHGRAAAGQPAGGPEDAAFGDAPVAPWQPPVLRLVARDGEGVEELYNAVEAHRRWLEALPADHPRRRRRFARELGFVLRSRLSRLLQGALAGRIDELAARVQRGELPLWEAVDQLRAGLPDEL